MLQLADLGLQVLIFQADILFYRVKVVDVCGRGQCHNCWVGKNKRLRCLVWTVNGSKRSPIAPRGTSEQLRLWKIQGHQKPGTRKKKNYIRRCVIALTLGYQYVPNPGDKRRRGFTRFILELCSYIAYNLGRWIFMLWYRWWLLASLITVWLYNGTTY